MARSDQVITVLVHGAKGRMGQEVLSALGAEDGLRPVAGVDLLPGPDPISLSDGRSIPYYTDVRRALAETKPQVVVDFTSAAGCMVAVRVMAEAGVPLVSGSTGLSDADLQEIGALCGKGEIGAVVVPNFALGAVLLIRLAAMAAPYFEYADITEMHHEAKVDAPSGTALAIAHAMAKKRQGFKRLAPEREPLPGTRGGDYDGITIHSSRMPGRLAHHQVTFGIQGQTLTLRHDSISRVSFMPGVMLAIQYVIRHRGLTVGLDKVMGL